MNRCLSCTTCSCRTAQLTTLFDWDADGLVPFAHDLRERFGMRVVLRDPSEALLDYANATTATTTTTATTSAAAVPAPASDDENKTLQTLVELANPRPTSVDDKRSGRKRTKKTPGAAHFDNTVLFKERGKFSYFPEHKSEALKAWFADHILWPYPNASETQELLFETGVTIRQLTNWFSNQRKRHWSAVFPDVIPQSRKAVEVFLIEKYGSINDGAKRLLAL